MTAAGAEEAQSIDIDMSKLKSRGSQWRTASAIRSSRLREGEATGAGVAAMTCDDTTAGGDVVREARSYVS